MNPYQPGEDNQDPYEVGYKAGAASRDAEVVSLTNQRDYEYERAEDAEQERDQLREHVTMLRDALERAIATCFDITSYEQIMSNPSHLINKALAVTELQQ